MARKKTTLYLDERQDRLTKALAHEQSRSQADIIREAIDAFIDDIWVRPLAIGVGHSGGGSVAKSEREWLKGFGEK